MRYLIVLLLSGCTMSPTGIREHGERFAFESKSVPQTALTCISRNAAEYHQTMHAQIHDAEVFVYAASGFGPMLMGIARAEPTSGGSRVTVMLQSMLLNRDDFVAALLKGC